jgi:hypothetical protein
MTVVTLTVKMMSELAVTQSAVTLIGLETVTQKVAHQMMTKMTTATAEVVAAAAAAIAA